MRLRKAVRVFAQDMERKLLANDHKPNKYQGMGNLWLIMRLRQETGELTRALAAGKNVPDEAADVANFAMFISDNFKRKASGK